MTTPLDLNGEPIVAGKSVAYLTTTKQKPAMNVGLVLAVHVVRGLPTVTIEPHVSSKGYLPTHLVRLSNTDRIVVI